MTSTINTATRHQCLLMVSSVTWLQPIISIPTHHRVSQRTLTSAAASKATKSSPPPSLPPSLPSLPSLAAVVKPTRVQSQSLAAPARSASGNRFMLVDCASMLYRAHFGYCKQPIYTHYPHPSTGTRLQVSALYGYGIAMASLLRGTTPSHVGICVDGRRADGFRRALYDQYKLQRPATPPELLHQMALIPALNEALGVRSWSAAGFEADDCIGALTKYATDDMPIQIVSADKDYAQLVSNHVHLARPSKTGTSYHGPDWVLGEYGIQPSQFADYLALVGDRSDNIPGCPGIGEKYATQLLQAYGSLEGILTAARLKVGWKFTEGIRLKIEMGEKKARLSLSLSTIVTHIDDTPSIGDFQWSGINQRALMTFMHHHNLSSLRPHMNMLPVRHGTHTDTHDTQHIFSSPHPHAPAAAAVTTATVVPLSSDTDIPSVVSPSPPAAVRTEREFWT